MQAIELSAETRSHSQMDISTYTSDPEMRSMIEDRIEKSIPKPKYLKQYPDWISKFKGGYSIGYIAAFWEVDPRLVKQTLYAMDLIDEAPVSIEKNVEENMYLEYYMDLGTTHETLRDKYAMPYEELVSRAVRAPAVRVMIEKEMDAESVEDISDSEFSEKEIDEIESRLREDPAKYGEEDWEMPEEDKSKKASDVLLF